VDENDQPEYIGVKMGLLGMSSTLIPMDLVRVNDQRQLVEVSADKDYVKDGPTFDDDREITPEYENEVYSYYGLQRADSAAGRGDYGSYYGEENSGAAGLDPATGTGGELRDRRGSGLEYELRMQRTEEELRAGTREREAGALSVRKRVRTDRETEEVSVERVPVEGETSRPDIREDEVSIPLTEEEVVVEKRPVVKKEIRVRKDVVEDTEVVEEDVRREEVEVDDATQRRNR
jgi:uncharacterized protein (TIGR02271 family)